MELRDYQLRAVDQVRTILRSSLRRVLIVSPTGSGKTVIAAHLVDLARAKGSSVLFVAHRKEIVDQTSAKLTAAGVRHGVMMPGHVLNGQARWPVQVASIQTLVRREAPNAQLVIVDEAHHARAATYESVSQVYGDVPLIGLTATPWRGDGRGLVDCFQASLLVAKPADLCAQGWLVPVRGFSYTQPDLSSVPVVRGDYDEAAAGAAMGTVKILGDLVTAWLDHSRGLRTVAFAVHVEHSRAIVAAFTAAGVRAEHLDGTTPRREREAILARLHSGETELVSNCAVLTEGWDEPLLGCVVLARPTKSVGLYLQMVGRGRRPAEGKTELRLHDHTGCALEHGSPDADRDWSLQADLRVRKGQQKPCADRACSVCGLVYPRREPCCPVCGSLPTSGQLQIEHVEAERVDLETHRPQRERDEYKAYLRETAIARGYKPGWVIVRFVEKFPNDPKPWGLYREVQAAQQKGRDSCNHVHQVLVDGGRLCEDCGHVFPANPGDAVGAVG